MSDLVPRLLFGSLDLTDAPYLLEFGSDFGGPETIQTAMAQLLQDGEIVSGDRSSNRELQFAILVEGSDFQAMADAEAALILEANRPRNTITWDPGDGWGPATVYDTFRATVKLERSDEMESARLRRYTLTIPALPFGRSVSETVAEAATPAAPSGTVVDDCDSITGWTAGAQTAVSSDTTVKATGTASVKASSAATNFSHYGTGAGRLAAAGVNATVAFETPLTVATLTYLAAQVTGDWPTVFRTWPTLVNSDGSTGGHLEPTSCEVQPNGFTRFTWQLPLGTFTGIEWYIEQTIPWPDDSAHQNEPSPPSVWIDDIESVGTTTGKQSVRTIDVAGSVRTPGSLEVAGPTSLGHALVFTAEDLQDGFRPDLSRWAVQGALTVDAATVSGAYFSPSTTYSDASGPNFEVPVSTLRAGGYSVLARVATGTAVTVSVDATLRIGGTNVGVIQETAGKVSGLGASTWQVVALGTLHLPPTMVPQGSAAVARLRVKASATGVKLDEVWLFPSSGDLTVVDCGIDAPSAAGSSSRLWLDSPSVAQPHGGVWRGTAADRSDSRAAGLGLIALGRHSFVPPRTLVFLATSNAGGATVALRHHARWHTSAAS